MRGSHKTLTGLIVSFVLIAALWDTSLVLPLKILVVFFHEISHGLAAILTGGSVNKLIVGVDQGGLACTSGGIRLVTLSAGYLGSFAWGAGLILAASWTKQDKAISSALGAVLVIVTLMYVRNRFGFVFGLVAGGAFFAAGRYLPDQVNDFLLKLVGLTSCGYAILDIWDDVIARSTQSDARMLAEITMIPAAAWGVFWIALTVIGTFYTLRGAARGGR